VVVTGAGRGIGAALALRIAAERPRGVVVSDMDGDAADAVAEQVRELGVPATALAVDVTDRDQLRHLVRTTQREHGDLDLVCSNAGVATGMGIHAADPQWERSWAVNVMAHVHLAQAVLPALVRRHAGHLMITASAVGLLGVPADAPYSVTKHAAVGLAEWLAFSYGHLGVKVSALCPLGVRTDLLMPGVEAGHPAARAVADAARILEPAEVAEAAVRGLAEDRFLILPHPEVAELHARKAANPDAWVLAQQQPRVRA
jgi:NAD(P)-dependent dehydrogenase (short-subunit alcohol dehydrogenase family)